MSIFFWFLMMAVCISSTYWRLSHHSVLPIFTLCLVSGLWVASWWVTLLRCVSERRRGASFIWSKESLCFHPLTDTHTLPSHVTPWPLACLSLESLQTPGRSAPLLGLWPLVLRSWAELPLGWSFYPYWPFIESQQTFSDTFWIEQRRLKRWKMSNQDMTNSEHFVLKWSNSPRFSQYISFLV